jgi:DNA-binding transcriptional regulator YiaG
MPNIASVLKEEIARVARKELKSSTGALKKAAAGYRSQIAALKRRLDALERQVKRASKGKLVAVREDDEEQGARLRWNARGFARHRQRLELSAADYGKLLGVSALSVYKWEGGRTRPRPNNLSAIAAVRKMGKKEAAERLGAGG